MNFREARALLERRKQTDRTGVTEAILTLFEWQQKSPEDKAVEILKGLKWDSVARVSFRSGGDNAGDWAWFCHIVMRDRFIKKGREYDFTELRKVELEIDVALREEIEDMPFVYKNVSTESEERKQKEVPAA